MADLKERVWESNAYYDMAHKGSLYKSHPGMKVLFQMAKKAEKILDMGCGEGTRINLIAKKKKLAVGIDLSRTAIKRAKKNYPEYKFLEADLVDLPFKDAAFDLVYSAFVLEHLDDPEGMILEAIRVLRKGGYLVLIAPNYGAPNRASPPFQKSRLEKFIKGLIADFYRPFFKINKLGWNRVSPLATDSKYKSDWDVTVEPYIGSLIDFLKSKGTMIKKTSSAWSEELPRVSFYQLIFRFLGELQLYPFRLWGPHLVVVAKKGD